MCRYSHLVRCILSRFQFFSIIHVRDKVGSLDCFSLALPAQQGLELFFRLDIRP
jgi:hypothetical protein